MTSSLRTDAGPPSWVKNKVTIVVVGDPKVGKTSLITSLVSDIFQENVAPKVAPVVITPASTPEHVEIQILDTSSAVEDEAQLDSDMKKADVICVVYAVNDPATKESIRTRWLPKIRHLGLTVPVVLVGNKFDLAASERTLEDLRRELEPIMNQYREVETCIECSAKTSLNVDEVFFFAQKAVIYPTAVLYDLAEGQFKPKCVAAFKRIFKLCDIDKDGVLDDHELNEFQKTCFEAPLSVDDLKKLKATIRRQQQDGITDRGLTLAGFLWLQHYFMKKGRLETIWTILRKFGYNDQLDIAEEYTTPHIVLDWERGERPELSSKAYGYLTDLFHRHKGDRDSALTSEQLKDMFSVCPNGQSPWDRYNFPHCTVVDAHGNLTLQGFLAMWSMTTLLDYKTSVQYLSHLRYPSVDSLNPHDMLDARRLHHPKKNRTVFCAVVLGSPGSGKSTLLRGLLNKPFQTEHVPTTHTNYAVNIVRGQRYLILIEAGDPSQEIATLQAIEKDGSQSAVDALVLLVDRTNPQSLKYAEELYETQILQCPAASPHQRHRERSHTRLSTLPVVVLHTKADLPRAPQGGDITVEAFCKRHRLSSPLSISFAKNEPYDVYNFIIEQILSKKNRRPSHQPESSTWTSRILWTLTVTLLIGASCVVAKYFYNRTYLPRANVFNFWKFIQLK